MCDAKRPIWYQGLREDGNRKPSEGTTSDSSIGCRHTFANIVAQVLAFARDFCERTSTSGAIGGLFSQTAGVLRRGSRAYAGLASCAARGLIPTSHRWSGDMA